MRVAVTDRISLALVLHNHQPVGNFGWVIAENHERAYEPLVTALERHPGVRVGLHYTGPLLEWLAAERPAFLDRLRALADRDQVDILGGGYFEPVLASLPDRDRHAQLVRMAETLERWFGRRPTVAWLAERVWEPDLPTALVDAGYRATILDDAHFRAGAVPEDAMWGPYTTDDRGRQLAVFGTEQGLRYRIPFRPVDETIAYLRAHATPAGDRLGTMGDDGEKFGGWPSTWELCWGKERWVDRFFEALEANADWLTTTTPAAWLADHAPVGRVYVPVSSYAEMGEWALPPTEGQAFHAALDRARRAQLPEQRWIRGTTWRNFQVRYREVNDLHKRMLRVSAVVATLAPGAARDRALDDLLRGQSNDAYWHGLFGGIYLPHLRLATIGHLVGAEDAADEARGRLVRAERADFDLDGRDEALLADAGQVVLVDLDEGGGIGAWDIRMARHDLAAVLRRRPEVYHADLVATDPAPGTNPDETDVGRSIAGGAVAKEAGLGARLVYDDHERRACLVRLLPPDATAATYGAGEQADLSDAPIAPHAVIELADGRLVTRQEVALADGGSASIRRTIDLSGSRAEPALQVTLEMTNMGTAPIDCRFGLEWPFMLLGGGHNPSAWLEVGGARGPHDGAGEATGAGSLRQGNDWLGLAIETTSPTSADAWWAPIETVSNSEGGYERVYQGSSLLLSWPLALDPGATWSRTVSHRITVRET